MVLLDIAVVLALAQLFGGIARRLGQPAVIGEIVAGIALGPSLLGNLVGDQLFPADVTSALEALADVGLVLFMFVVGMELDRKLVRGSGKVAASVSAGSTLLPFGLGCLLALWLAGDHHNGARLPFVLFFGTAMAATAFPVLARILTDRGMHRTPLGGLALASAAIIDVAAWTGLAIALGLAGAGSEQWRVVLAVPFAILMLAGVRPLLRRLPAAYERAGRLTPGLLGVVLIGLFAAAWATEWMHVHFIFGAFLFGAVMPRKGAEVLNREILGRLEQLAVLLLLPMFFVVAGMSVDLTRLDVGSVGALVAILGVAIAGKVTGAYAGARLQRVPNRQAAALAVLINTRGLTEIVILTVGLQKGLLDQELYSLMVLMALLTTAMTGPLLNRILGSGRVQHHSGQALRHRSALVVALDPGSLGRVRVGIRAARARTRTGHQRRARTRLPVRETEAVAELMGRDPGGIVALDDRGPAHPDHDPATGTDRTELRPRPTVVRHDPDLGMLTGRGRDQPDVGDTAVPDVDGPGNVRPELRSLTVVVPQRHDEDVDRLGGWATDGGRGHQGGQTDSGAGEETEEPASKHELPPWAGWGYSVASSTCRYP